MKVNRPFFLKGNIKNILKYEDIERILINTDIIVTNKRHYYIESIWSQYIHAHKEQSLIKLKEIIHELYPEYDAAFDGLKKRTWGHMFNMFIMKRDKFDEYCEWLFSILFELEKNINNIEPRLFGFLSERLLDVWLEANQYKYKEIPVGFMESQNWLTKIRKFISRKFSN